jgi:hypothetical protein
MVTICFCFANFHQAFFSSGFPPAFCLSADRLSMAFQRNWNEKQESSFQHFFPSGRGQGCQIFLGSTQQNCVKIKNVHKYKILHLVIK